MKKLLIAFAFLSISTFLFTACEKSELTHNNEETISQKSVTRAGGSWCGYHNFTLTYLGKDENGCCIYDLAQTSPNSNCIGDAVIVSCSAPLLGYSYQCTVAHYKYKVCPGQKFVATVWGWNAGAQSYSDWCQSFLLDCQ